MMDLCDVCKLEGNCNTQVALSENEFDTPASVAASIIFKSTLKLFEKKDPKLEWDKMYLSAN